VEDERGEKERGVERRWSAAKLGAKDSDVGNENGGPAAFVPARALAVPTRVFVSSQALRARVVRLAALMPAPGRLADGGPRARRWLQRGLEAAALAAALDTDRTVA
jgi:hypothetical protein